MTYVPVMTRYRECIHGKYTAIKQVGCLRTVVIRISCLIRTCDRCKWNRIFLTRHEQGIYYEKDYRTRWWLIRWYNVTSGGWGIDQSELCRQILDSRKTCKGRALRESQTKKWVSRKHISSFFLFSSIKLIPLSKISKY